VCVRCRQGVCQVCGQDAPGRGQRWADDNAARIRAVAPDGAGVNLWAAFESIVAQTPDGTCITCRIDIHRDLLATIEVPLPGLTDDPYLRIVALGAISYAPRSGQVPLRGASVQKISGWADWAFGVDWWDALDGDGLLATYGPDAFLAESARRLAASGGKRSRGLLRRSVSWPVDVSTAFRQQDALGRWLELDEPVSTVHLSLRDDGSLLDGAGDVVPWSSLAPADRRRAVCGIGDIVAKRTPEMLVCDAPVPGHLRDWAPPPGFA
jgi:hypothetical protein